ncbi:MAG: hypothetical protein HY270_12395 [Deltaproteobacteria bacterium]|nr:hypothetical protein [Deltaproteobacteria bacterium]
MSSYRGSLRQALATTVVLAALSVVQGCPSRHAIVAVTATNIGVDVSQNPTTSSPQAKLGYQRTEIAIVPTNRSADVAADGTGGGAKDHGDVVMELRYGGIFDLGKSSGIYQRLAVGTEAVRQPGASVMFAKDDEGNVGSDAKAALASLNSVPTASTEVETKLRNLRQLRRCHKTEVDAAITSAGPTSFDEVMDLKVTIEQLNKIAEATKSLSPCP